MGRRTVPLIALLSIGVLTSNLPVARASEVSHARIVRLSYAQGAVEFSGADSADDSSVPGQPATAGWQKAIVNTPVREGMSLATGEGRAEVEFESGALAWISSNTVLEFPQLALADGAKLTQLVVRQGTASFEVKSGKHDSFFVRAGGAQILVPGSARFRVDVFGDGTSITVLRGAVEVDAGGKPQRVDSKSTLTLHNVSPDNFALSASPAKDGWDRWVADRGRAVENARYDSSAYMDSGVGYGMADLSFYGGWLTLPGYGYVWQPWGAGSGWFPFFSGYWNNFGPFGPTWISYEPWGWLPYHYGGWILSPFYGWVWAPGGFGAWSPATVAWLQTPVGIGWVPLAPKDAPGRAPANLAHGVVTNTATGMAAQLPNSMLAASSLSSVRVAGAWQNDPELARVSKQALAAVRASPPGSPRLAMAGAIASAWHPEAAERMPAGPAPRLARAASFQGTIPRYRPPTGISAGQSSPSRSGSGGWSPPAGSAMGSSSVRSAGSGGDGSHGSAAGGSGGAHGGGGGKP